MGEEKLTTEELDELRKKCVSLDDLSSELETVEGRISSTIEAITANSARIGDDPLAFGPLEEHKKKLAALVQSVDDLTRRREQLRLARTAANAAVPVEMADGTVLSIHEALDMERRSINWREAARRALKTGWEHANLENRGRSVTQPVIQLYSEEQRLKQLAKLSELKAKIMPAVRRGNRDRFVQLHDDGSFTLHVALLSPPY